MRENRKYIFAAIALVLLTAGSVSYQAIRHDITMTGAGITGDELKVDSSVMATQYDLVSERTMGNTISPAQLTSDQDNYEPTGWQTATVVRLSSDSGMRAITSLAAPTVVSTSVAVTKLLINIGSYTIYFPAQHPDGTSTNRIDGGSDYKLYPGKSCEILYDPTSTRWRILTEESSEGKTGVFYSWSAGSVTAGDYGELGIAAISSGTIAATSATSTLPAAATLSTATNAAWGYNIWFAKTVGEFSAYATAHIYVEAIITLPVLSDGTDTYTTEIQIHPNPDGSSVLEINNMFGVRYSHGINSGEWELFTQGTAGAESVADLNVAVAANTIYKIRLELDKSKTEVRAYINGVFAGRVTGNIPDNSACGARIVHLKSVGTTARTLNVHSFSAGAIYN
jgi:hypothetical protein